MASTLVRGPSLAEAVTETGPLPPAAVGWIALGLARALATLHRAGLTHRAVTPRNVVLDARAVLTDFGVNRTALRTARGASPTTCSCSAPPCSTPRPAGRRGATADRLGPARPGRRGRPAR